MNEPPQRTQAAFNKAVKASVPIENVVVPPQPRTVVIPSVPMTPRAIGQDLAAKRGWTGTQWQALERLWHNESGWNPNAINRSSGACGIVQSYPCSKLGANWRDPTVQIEWGLNYIANRYGTPSNALAFWLRQSPHWY